MIPLPPPGTEARKLYVQRMLNDTGFFCRAVLGMDTDKDATGIAVGERGKGGVRETGPHQDFIVVLDDEGKQYVQQTAPRFAYKSSMIEGFICRLILRHPNISIMSAMGTKADAQERVQKVRDILTSNPIIKELFGNVQGEAMWRNDRFITSLRTEHTIFSPTLYAASPQIGLAGGRPDVVVLDDVVTELSAQSDLGRKKAINFVESAITTQGRSTIFRHVTTPWHPGDAFHYLMEKGWETYRDADAGVRVFRKEDGTVEIEGTEEFPNGRWPNLPVEHLRRIVKGKIRFETFMSQFMLRCVQGLEAPFKATQFTPVNWTDSFRELTGFLLCDTAPSGKTDGDLNVLLYIGMDARGHLYILDCEVGFWLMYEFCERYLEMIARWSAKVNHRGEVWEKTQCYYPYTEHIALRAVQRNSRSQILYAEKRTQINLTKDLRVKGLSVRFQSRQVSVCMTVPRVWNSGTKTLPLWDPTGDHDPETRMPIPGGELVDQFTRHGHHKRDDIPDTLALVNAIDEKTKMRVCFHVPSAARHVPQETLRTSEEDQRYLRLGSSQRFFEKWSGR